MQCAVTASQTGPPRLRTDASLASLAEYRMSRYGVTPNLLILPPQMLLYMALAPEQKLTCASAPLKRHAHSPAHPLPVHAQVQGGRPRGRGPL